MRKENKRETLLTIKEDVAIGNGIILEKGDKIRIIKENSSLFNSIINKLDAYSSNVDNNEVALILADWFELNFKNQIKAIDIDIMPMTSFQSYVDEAYRDFLVADSDKAEKLNKWFDLY